MRRYFATLLLCSAPLACADQPLVDDAPAARPNAQTADAARIDAGRAPSDGTAALADAATADATSPRDDAASLHDASSPTAPPADDACKGISPDAGDKAALHAAAADLLTQQTPCGFSSCHTGSSRARAGLRLLGATDLRTLLVDKPSCLAPEVPLVDGSGGAEALARSWLWQKLIAPTDGNGALQSKPGWGASDACGQDPSEPFGQQMPLSTGPLEEADLAVVRSWICAGAPGPT